MDLRVIPGRIECNPAHSPLQNEINGGFFKNFWVYFFNDIGGALLQQPAMLHGVKIRAEGM